MLRRDEGASRTPESEEYTTEYYTHWCRTHEELLAAHVPSGYPRAIAYLSPEPGDSILDIGCGRGEIVAECAARGADAVGADYSQAAVQIAKKGDKSRILRASGTSLPFASQTFDKVLFMEVLEMIRVLKPGGCIVGSTPNAWGAILSVLGRLAGAVGIGLQIATRDDPYHVNVKNPVSVWRLLRKHALEVRLFTGQDYRFGPMDVPLWKRAASKLLFFAFHIWWIARKSA